MKRPTDSPPLETLQQWLDESDTAERITWRAIERWGLTYGAKLPSHAHMDVALAFINPYKDSDFTLDMFRIREQCSGLEIEIQTIEAIVRLLNRMGKWFRKGEETVPEGKEFAYGLG